MGARGVLGMDCLIAQFQGRDFKTKHDILRLGSRITMEAVVDTQGKMMEDSRAWCCRLAYTIHRRHLHSLTHGSVHLAAYQHQCATHSSISIPTIAETKDLSCKKNTSKRSSDLPLLMSTRTYSCDRGEPWVNGQQRSLGQWRLIPRNTITLESNWNKSPADKRRKTSRQKINTS